MLYAFSGESKLVVATGLDCVDTRLALAWLGISDALGFDVEWSVGLGVAQRPALLQLCSGQRCLLMRLHTTSVLPECLVGILTDVDIVKTGVGIGGDFTRLVNSFRFVADKDCGLVDVARLASVAGHRGEGSLRALVKTYLGYELDKRVHHDSWASSVLSSRLQSYAAADAAAGLLLFKKLSSLEPTARLSNVFLTPDTYTASVRYVCQIPPVCGCVGEIKMP